LRFVSENSRISLLNRMTYKHIRVGERFIRQGEVGDTAYIIEQGSCLVIVEKDGELYPVGHRGEGDIVGVTALLTGEPQHAHVEAQTGMKAWVLNRALFKSMSKENPELLSFLTELVAERFDSRRPTVDRRIGKYVATDIIGRGGYSIVYKGVHVDLNMPVAIKMMKHDLAMDPDFLSSFHNEAKTIASLNHENIIRVYDIEERFRTVFIIEELVEGESLKDLIGRLKTIPPPVATDFLIQICSGLSYAHQRGIIHRDINASNIFVLRDDRVKILDFGLACPIGTEDLTSSGTVFYMAPEQIEGEAVDQRTDIYALGLTAYEMLTGQRPFPEEDIGSLMEKHLNEDVPDPATMVPNLPEALRGFIRRACRRSPDQRYQDVGQALEALQLLAKEFGLTRKNLFFEKPKMTTLFIMYKGEHQLALNRLMEDFSNQVRELGAVLKAANFSDV